MGTSSENGVAREERSEGNGEVGNIGGSGVGVLGANGTSDGGNRQLHPRRVETRKGKPHNAKGDSDTQGALERLAGKATAILSVAPLDDESGRERWPLLLSILNAVKDVNGDDCEPGGFSATAKAGRLSWSLRSPAYNVRVSGWADTLEGLLDTMERALGDGRTAFVELKKHVSKKFRDKQKRT